MDLLGDVLNNKLALVLSFIICLAIIGLLLGLVRTLWTCTIEIFITRGNAIKIRIDPIIKDSI